MPKKKYSEEIHIERLRKMLNSKKEPCGYCPAAPRFSTYCNWRDTWADRPHPCEICRLTIGLQAREMNGTFPCPCHVLDAEEAMRKAKLLVEENNHEKEKSRSRNKR
jgi:hypothetical protein